MSPEIPKAPTGTHDVLPPESARWQALEGTFAGLAARAGFGQLRTPVFEEIGVFKRVGEGTDVVRKEMYDFEDRGGRHLALRPEGTAPVVRAFVQHRPPTPWKAWYVTPMFRYERPQAGRYRQHHQLGVEALGSDDPDLDVEVIALQHDFYVALGLQRVQLVVNSLGDADGRPAYEALLVDYLESHGRCARSTRRGCGENPLRVLDCKRPACVEAHRRRRPHRRPPERRLPSALRPGPLGSRRRRGRRPRSTPGSSAGSTTTPAPPWSSGRTPSPAPRTASAAAAATTAWSSSWAARPRPGSASAPGIERVLLACDAEELLRDAAARRSTVFVVDVVGGDAARDLVAELRRAGIARRPGLRRTGRMKSQMKQADRSGARGGPHRRRGRTGRRPGDAAPLRRRSEQVRIGRAEP